MRSAQPQRPGWAVKHADGRLGRLTLVEFDQPWFICEFEPGERWASVAQLFEAQERAVALGFPSELAEAFRAVRDLGLELESLTDGSIIHPWPIYLGGDRPRFRH